jgi:hypothetical protein
VKKLLLRVRLALALALAIAAPVRAAQEPASPALAAHVKTMPLPGGVAGLGRVLRVEATPDRSRFFVDVIRRLYNLSLDTVMPEDRRDVEGYFAALSALRTALAPFGATPGISLKLLTTADKRAESERLLHALGLRLAVGDAAGAATGVGTSVSAGAPDGGARAARTNAAGAAGGAGPQVVLDDDRAAVARRTYVAAAGVDPEAVARGVNAGEAVSIALTRDEVPLPLGVGVWRRVVVGEAVAEDELAGAILLQRRAACFYHALASLDEPTLGYLDAHQHVLASLFQRRAEVMTTFGRSIRILDGRVVVPGGAAAAPIWEEILEHKVTEPDAFIDTLFARDGGRLAFLYDTLAHVPEPVRQLVLTVRGDGIDGAIERVRRLARVFAAVTPAWHVVESPMWRPAVDPAMWLNELRVSTSNPTLLAAAFTQGIWNEIFRSDNVTNASEAVERAAEKTEENVPADVGWLAEEVFLDDPAQQRERYEMTLWAQRVFATLTAASPDIAGVIAACRGYGRFGLLLLTLERMDVRDPTIFRDAVTRAAAIASRGGGERERISLALYQASLALIERLRLTRRLDLESATSLVRTFVQIPLDDQEPAAVAKWIDTNLVSALGPAPASDTPSSVETRLLDALAGGQSGAGAVQWEGQSYRVDVAGAERARMLAVRRGQGAFSLDTALEAFRGHESRDKRDKKASRQAAGALAEALVSIVYAAHLPGDRPEMLQNAAWRQHDFGQEARPEMLRRRLAWLLAEERMGGGIAWHLRGSLLALDLAMAKYHLRRISDDPPTPTISEGDRVSATVGVMLLNPFDATDADRDRLTATLARGRAAIADRAHDAAALLALAQRAGFSEWRLQALRWSLAEAQAAPDFEASTSAAAASRTARDPESAFAMIDQFWAGEPDAATIERVDRWGPSIIPITGQLATRLPRPRAWEDFAGRLGTGMFATQVADVHLQTASFLASHQLPAALYRGAMAAAMQELVDRAPVRQFDDWSALVMYVRTLPSARYEDYVAALAVDGPLRTLDDGEVEVHE